MIDRRSLIKLGAAAPALIATKSFAQPAGDRLRLSLREGVPNIAPYSNSQRTGLVIAHHIWDTLIYRDPQTFEPKPLLATAWTWVDDMTIDLTLRRGVKFHNGDEFSADDVVYTINSVADPNARVAVPGNVNWMERAEALAADKVRLKLRRPFPAAIEYLSMTVPILPKAYSERVGPDAFSRAPVGCGPYRVTKIEPAASIELERFEDYFRDSPKGRPAIGKIGIRFVPDTTTEMTELLSGQADWIWKVGVDQFPKLARLPQLKTVRGEAMRINYLSIDAAGRSGAGNPLTKAGVRRAIFHAIDRAAMAKQLVGEGAGVPDAPCYRAQFGCDAGSASRYDFDPEKAKTLLAEAGYPSGFETELVTYLEPNLGAAIQNYLRAVGIRARVSQLQTAAAIQKAWRGEAPLYAGSWGSYSINDVSAIFPTMFGGGNDDYVRDPELNRLVALGSAERDPARRLSAYQQVIKQVTADALWLPLTTTVINYAHTAKLVFTPQADELPRFWLARWA